MIGGVLVLALKAGGLAVIAIVCGYLGHLIGLLLAGEL